MTSKIYSKKQLRDLKRGNVEVAQKKVERFEAKPQKHAAMMIEALQAGDRRQARIHYKKGYQAIKVTPRVRFRAGETIHQNHTSLFMDFVDTCSVKVRSWFGRAKEEVTGVA